MQAFLFILIDIVMDTALRQGRSISLATKKTAGPHIYHDKEFWRDLVWCSNDSVLGDRQVYTVLNGLRDIKDTPNLLPEMAPLICSSASLGVRIAK